MIAAGWRWLLLGLCLPLLAFSRSAAADPAPDTVDVRIIVDISGSMKETDPDNLRQPAVRLLARMLPEGATAGLWTFGQYVNMLVPHQPVSPAWRQLAIERSALINSVALRTNLGRAIEVASDDWITHGSLAHTHFILLTDGRVDLSPDPASNQAEEQRILETLLPRLAARGATFHPVALSEQADTDFLRQLAIGTGGSFHMAHNAEELSLAFLEALDMVVRQPQIPLENGSFLVDPGVQEFTALIFRGRPGPGLPPELSLVRPDQTVLKRRQHPENVRWVREPGYDLITVSSPRAGRWHVTGILGEGSRVTVVSDLQMLVADLPARFTPDEPVDVEVSFSEGGERITRPDFLRVIQVRLTLTSEDGRMGSKILSPEGVPEDGIYRDRIARLPDPGRYHLEVVADGRTFARRFTSVLEFVVPQESPAQVEPSLPAPVTDEAAAPAPSSQIAATTGEVSGSVPQWLLLLTTAILLLLLAGAVVLVLWRRRGRAGRAVELPLVSGDAEGGDGGTPVADNGTPQSATEEVMPAGVAEPGPGKDEKEEFALEDLDLSELESQPGDNRNRGASAAGLTPESGAGNGKSEKHQQE